jgi:hypothetical protein
MKLTKKLEKELFFELILFFSGIILISLLYTNNILLTFLLVLIWSIGIKGWYKHHDVYFLVSGAIIGTVAEIICIYFGVWKYANPIFLGIPLWLPLAWGLAVVLIKRFGEIFIKIEKK